MPRAKRVGLTSEQFNMFCPDTKRLKVKGDRNLLEMLSPASSPDPDLSVREVSACRNRSIASSVQSCVP